jgi:tRNA pseudouridine13 synthase
MEAEEARPVASQPYLTGTVAGIGGRIRSEPEDFRVEERPLYVPCGEGEHLYVKVTKRLLSTPDLIRRLSSTLGVKVQGIGAAGLKDARAVTTQFLSLHGVTEERISRVTGFDWSSATSLQERRRPCPRSSMNYPAGVRRTTLDRNAKGRTARTIGLARRSSPTPSNERE